MAAASSAASDAYSLEELSAVEREVIAILYELSGIVQSRRRHRTGVLPEIPSWGRRRRRSVFAYKAGGGEAPVREGAASPDTPLAFPVASGGDEEEREEAAVAAAAAKKPRRHREWVEEQSSMVAKLSQEKTHLLQQIEEYRARLESLRTTNENLKQMQNKLKQEREEEEEARKQKMQHTPGGVATDQTAAAASGRVALGLDLNVPARSPEEEAAAAAAWYRGQQMMYRAAMAAEARRRRREIRRSKNSLPATSSQVQH